MPYRVSSSIDYVCVECGGDDFIQDAEIGELVCTRCGVIVSDIDQKLGVADPSLSSLRGGGSVIPLNPIFTDWGLATTIGRQGKDHFGRRLDDETYLIIKRLRKWNSRSIIGHSKDQNLKKALDLMKALADDLQLPKSVLNTGVMFYRKALKKNLMYSYNIRYTVAGCVYAACRKCQVLRTLSEISKFSGVPKRQLSRYYKLLYDRLDLKVASYPKSIYVNRLASRLGLLEPIENFALLIMAEAEKNLLTQGCRPESIAAACLYISVKHFGVNITQSLLAENANTTEVTLRNRYKSLLKLVVIESYL